MEQPPGALTARILVRAYWVGLSLLTLMVAEPASTSSYLPDPGAEALERSVTTGGSLSMSKDTAVTGDVHSNGAVALASGVEIDGDLSSSGPIALNGASVTGSVTPFVPSRPLPALPSVEEARDLADRVFEGDQTFASGTVIDDIVFVAGSVRFRGSINGTGTVIAGTEIRFDNVSAGQPAVLDPETRMAFVSLGSVWVGKSRSLRGEILAAGSVQLNKELDLSGLVSAGGSLALHKDSTIVYSAPEMEQEDVDPPVLFDLRPAGGEVLPLLTPEIEASFADAGSGVDLDSVILRLDGVDRTADSLVTLQGISFTSAAALQLGDHTVSVSVADLAGNSTRADWTFTLVDLASPIVTIESPHPGTQTGDPQQEVVGTVVDDRQVVSVTVNGIDAPVVGTTFRAFPVLAEGYNGLQVVATDLAGNQGFASGDVVLDTQPPEVLLTAPTDGQLVNGGTVRVAGRVRDSRGLAAADVNGLEVDLVEGGFELSVSLLEGSNLVTATAVDLAGNVTEVTREVVRYTLPDVAITSPTDLSFVAATTVTVSGSVSDNADVVTVNGVLASLDGSTFTAQGVPLIEGGNTVTATAAGPLGRVATDTIHVVRDLTPPRVAIYLPSSDQVHEATVAVSGLVNDIVPGTVNEGEASVTVNGLPAQVANRSFFVRDVPFVPGENTLVAAAVDASGNTAEARATVYFQPASGEHLRIVSGNHQSAPIGTALANPLVVELLDGAGQPLAGQPVVFYLRGNNGSLDGGVRRRIVVTDDAGRAEAQFTLGTRAGLANQVVHVAAVGLGQPVEFAASAVPGAPEEVVVDSGGLQVGVAGRGVPRPLIAAVIDSGNNRLAGVPVRFQVIEGQGVFVNGAREVVVPSDSDGRAIVSLTLDPRENIAGNVVVASLADVDDGPFATFVSSGRAAGPPEQTSVSGVVLDNTNVPIAGATLRIKGTVLTGTSDSEGQFRIDGAPVGAIKLIADGSTVERPGSWPDLEFDLVTIPGRDNTVNMPIFLLPLDLGSGIVVDETHGGTLTLADYPGFALDVAPGSVFFPGGGRSGHVSVTVVHNDKVPMTPNFGQQPRMIVTIQPAGARFDPPARLTLPNVEGLDVGEVTEMYSFDHDLGHFVSIGPATVSEDGTVIVSDPGVGILKAGWHCGGNPASSGAPHDCPSCRICNGSTCVPGCSIGSSSVSGPADLGLPGSPIGLVAKAGECSCSDGDSCTVGDTCGGSGGCTPGERKRITSVTAEAQGPGGGDIYIGDTVQFTSDVEHERCESLDYLWKLGDGTEATTASTSHAFDRPGTYNASLKVECDDCDTGTDQASVTVKCPEVEITDADPDVPYVCPDCEIQYTATIDPPGRTIYWSVLFGGLGGKATIDSSGLLRIAADAPEGVVAVRASALPDGSACNDGRTVSVFVPPPEPKVPGELSDAERAWVLSNLGCAFTNSSVESKCTKDTTAHVGRPNDGTKENAWQHAYCNCIVTARCGVAAAQGLWDAHEEYEGNPCTHATMDLHNNQVGRQVATDDESQCTQLIDDALANGRLRWLDPPRSTGCPTFKGTP